MKLDNELSIQPIDKTKDIPIELARHIASFLDKTNDIFHLSLVNKFWSKNTLEAREAQKKIYTINLAKAQYAILDVSKPDCKEKAQYSQNLEDALEKACKMTEEDLDYPNIVIYILNPFLENHPFLSYAVREQKLTVNYRYLTEINKTALIEVRKIIEDFALKGNNWAYHPQYNLTVANIHPGLCKVIERYGVSLDSSRTSTFRGSIVDVYCTIAYMKALAEKPHLKELDHFVNRFLGNNKHFFVGKKDLISEIYDCYVYFKEAIYTYLKTNSKHEKPIVLNFITNLKGLIESVTKANAPIGSIFITPKEISTINKIERNLNEHYKETQEKTPVKLSM